MRLAFRRAMFCAGAAALFLALAVPSQPAHAQGAKPARPADGNRLTYLDENNPYYPHLGFPKLTTPQWVGEEGVDCVVVLAIDDMREPAKYEAVLRPVLNRLKQIDGRAPVSIMTCNVKPDDPQLAQWLAEGLSIEVHTVDHPCPLLSRGDIARAKSTYDRCIDLLGEIPGNKPVAFRMPCCDSLNTVSPRFFSDIFNKTTPKGNSLAISSSVFVRYTPDDPEIPRALAIDEDGNDRFAKYIPSGVPRNNQQFDTFVNVIENYPYPYVINRMCWEFPCITPSDWSAQHMTKVKNNPVTIRDLKAALDITVVKKGVFNLVFHPYDWITPESVVELVDHAATKHGKKVKFLTFKEALDRLNTNLLAGVPLRDVQGNDNGVRLADLDGNSFIDVVVSNGQTQKTRTWNEKTVRWQDGKAPRDLVLPKDSAGPFHLKDARFAFLDGSGAVSLFVNKQGAGRFRDIDGDGVCELLTDGGIYSVNPGTGATTKLPFALPAKTALPELNGRDTGLRFVDVDEDGRDDIVFSDAERYGVYLFENMQTGWSRKALEGTRSVATASGGRQPPEAAPAGAAPANSAAPQAAGGATPAPRGEGGAAGQRGQRGGRRGGGNGGARNQAPPPEDRTPIVLPPIARADGTDNGFFVHSRTLFWQNEDTDRLLDLVDRVAFNDIIAKADLPPEAKSPQASLEAIKVRPGFKVELVASEPLTYDPVAFAFGADGKLWLVEMGDYPSGEELSPKNTPVAQAGSEAVKPKGRIRFLEDTNGDGKFDKSTNFLDVPFPTGVLPWKKGVLISAAPHVFYAEDTDGDGKADVRETLYTGFGEGNQQHRVNGLVRGVDNWIYLANGDSNGTIRYVGKAPSKQKDAGPIEFSGRDLRIRPETGEVEAVSGSTQFGRNRDDWGNWFGCNNSNPMYQFVLDDHYQRRNPNFAAPMSRSNVPEVAGNAPVFPISVLLARFNDYHTANRFTSACSAIIYRDTLFGPQFAGSMFVSEPVHNLVHWEPVTLDGLRFRSRRAPDEQKSEFLASSDNWFRPTMIQTGPDGALWIADMYRHVIEHPKWIPDAFQKKLDLLAGYDKGRIYRVYPVDTSPRAIPRLDKLDAAGLVAALDSDSGWQRDTAQQLMIERWGPGAPAAQGAGSGSAAGGSGTASSANSARGTAECVALLEKQFRDSKNPLCRLHSLCTLDGLAALTPAMVQAGLQDAHAGVRRHAIRLSENFRNNPGSLIDALVKLVSDKDPFVQLQLAYSLGEFDDPRVSQTLGAMLVAAQSDRFQSAAVMSSLKAGNIEGVLASVTQSGEGAKNASLMETLLNQAAALGNNRAFGSLLANQLAAGDGASLSRQYATVGSLLDTLERRRQSLADLAKAGDQIPAGVIQRLKDLLESARKTATDASKDADTRAAAARLLGRGFDQQTADRDRLAGLLSPQTPPALQSAAITALARFSEPEAATALLAPWRGYGPARRTQVLDALMNRTGGIEAVLTAIEKGDISPGDVDAARRERLVTNRSQAIRTRATKLLATSADAGREQVIEKYRETLSLKGDAAHGAEVFAKVCGQCHKLANVGHEVGPDLTSLTDKSPEALLVAVLDPNRAVETKFLNYSAITKAGLTITGILASETGNSVTLKGPEAKEQTVLREDLDELLSTSKSAMPEGLEKDISPRDLADVIAHIRSNIPIPARKEFSGNTPDVVAARPDGSLVLTSVNAEIYGSTMIFETKYGNLGFWASADDYAMWTVDAPAAGSYKVTLLGACHDRNSDNPYRLEAPESVLAGRVKSTGDWDTYKEQEAGEIVLAKGRQRIALRPVGRPQGSLIDLKSITLTPIK